jgi:hypothetical protein
MVGHLALFLSGPAERQNIMVRRRDQEKSVHLMVARKYREGSRVPISPSRA